MNLKNARVLVIGGTSGIGLGVATAVAERGAVPIVASRRQSSVDRALSQLPDGARGTVIDVGDSEALERVADDIGPIEHLVYTAGDALVLGKLADLDAAAITDFFATRFVGALNAVRVFAPRITEGGSVTLTTGIAAHLPSFGILPVSISAAMNAATTALAAELAPIRVNAVAPGVIRTPLWDSIEESTREASFGDVEQRVPLGRVGEVDDTALAYVYCIEQTYGTGVVLTVDGGTLLV